jgi:class 3 adenylate cyclase
MTHRPATILTVDDEPDVEPLIRQGLKRETRDGRYDLLFASDGVEALEVLEEAPSVELVLTDLNMPRMDGLTLLGRMHEMDRPLKAVVVTAYGDVENIRTAMNRGAFDFLMKPLLLEDLRTTVRKAVEAVEQQKQAERVRETFGRYLSAEVAQSLLAHPGALKLGGEKRRVSLLMSDIRGFSTVSESLPPETVVEILNTYLGRMAEVISEYGGTIIEYIGDAIFVVFGAPLQRDNDALRAVACATAMQLAMADVNRELTTMGIRRLEMGIGLHTGEVVIGNIGSERRAKYGAVGSHVNLVGRIEAWTVGEQIFASSETMAAAGPTVKIGLESTLVAKGFSRPVELYEVRGVGSPYNLALPDRHELYVGLHPPRPCDCALLDGKALTGETQHGTVLRISRSSMIVSLSDSPELMSNVRLSFQLSDEPGQSLDDVYGKVVEMDDDENEIKIRFTAVPDEVSDAIEELYASGEPGA